jgi:FAD binding domain
LSWKRREFLKGALSAPVVGAFPFDSLQRGTLVNDEHTGTNPTWVERIVKPSSATEIQELVKTCQKHRKPISVAASRHSSGSQQFATDSVMLDMRSLNRYLGFDAQSGILSVENGIEWPEQSDPVGIWNSAIHRAGQRLLPGVGEATVCVRDFYVAHANRCSRDEENGKPLQNVAAGSNRARRQLLFDLQSLCYPQ